MCPLIPVVRDSPTLPARPVGGLCASAERCQRRGSPPAVAWAPAALAWGARAGAAFSPRSMDVKQHRIHAADCGSNLTRDPTVTLYDRVNAARKTTRSSQHGQCGTPCQTAPHGASCGAGANRRAVTLERRYHQRLRGKNGFCSEPE